MVFAKKQIRHAVAVVALSLAGTAAHASIIADFLGVTNSITHPGAYDFRYSLTLAANEQIATGSFFVFYDWGTAFLSVPTSSTGLVTSNFSFTEQLTGPQPVFFSVPDSGTVLNIVGTYTGATVSGFVLGNGASGNLGTFVLTSPLGGLNNMAYQASQAQQFNPTGSGTGMPDSNAASNTNPALAPAAVPEPPTVALIGGALALAALSRRRRSAIRG